MKFKKSWLNESVVLNEKDYQYSGNDGDTVKSGGVSGNPAKKSFSVDDDAHDRRTDSDRLSGNFAKKSFSVDDDAHDRKTDSDRMSGNYEANDTEHKKEPNYRTSKILDSDIIELKVCKLMDYTTYLRIANKSGDGVFKCSSVWWLEDGNDSGGMDVVTEDGSIKNDKRGSYPNTKHGFRPMIRVAHADLDDVKTGEPIKSLNNEWIKVDRDVLLAKEPFAQIPFYGSLNELNKPADQAYIGKYLKSWMQKYFSKFEDRIAWNDAQYQKLIDKSLKSREKEESLKESIKADSSLLGESDDPDYTDDYHEKGFRWYKITYNVRDVDDTIRHEDAEMTVLAKDKDGAMNKFMDSTEYLNKHGFYASDVYVKLNEDLASDIRKNNLDYDDEIDALYKKDGDTEIQFQDRETHLHDMKSPSPRISSHTWGRVWKNGKLDKSFDGSKYEVRQNMAKYLDSKNESFRMKSNIPDLEEVAQQIWEDFQPDKMGEENWIEFDNDDARKMLGTNNETMSFEAIGPNSKVRGAMRTQGNRIHVAIRNGSEGVFDSVEEIEDFIKGAVEGFGK